MNKWLSGFLLVLLITACEKNINFDLKQTSSVLVVDANVENGRNPVVVLSSSLNYFSNISAGLLESTFVHNAIVKISDGVRTEQLKEYAYPQGNGYFLYSYGIDTSITQLQFPGTLNTGYTLYVNANGKEYHANTTIPYLNKRPDSLWWASAPYQQDSTKILLYLQTTDPPGLGNYIRYFTKKNHEPFYPGLNSVFSDEFVDGTTYQVQLDPGVNRNLNISQDSNYFRRGDTITVKLCNIDKATYTFWNTWEFAYQSIGNPFAQPNKVIGNIDNGALGAFYGYGAAYNTIVVPK